MKLFISALLLTSSFILHPASSSSLRRRTRHLKAIRTVCKTPCGNGLCVTSNYYGVIFSRCERCQVRNFVKATGLDANGKLICENINECASPSLNDCNPVKQQCIDIDSNGYTCKDLVPSETFLNAQVPSVGRIQMTGYYDKQELGYSVASAGDVNGDGIDDVIIGSPGESSDSANDVGFAYIIFGRKGVNAKSLTANLKSSLNGTNGFAVYGKLINDRLGESVSAAGDVNGDGIDDVIIGAPGVDVYSLDGTFAGDAGEAYVVYGSRKKFPPSISAKDISGDVGMTIQGSSIQDQLGESVSKAGDVNGDGIDDVIVGAPNANTANNLDGGKAYVVFGSKSLPGRVYVSALSGKTGFAIRGASPYGYLGVAVSLAGDLNKDGIDDVIVGANGINNPDGVPSGAAYVIYGRKTTFPSSLGVGALDGSNGFTIYGTGRDRFGSSLSHVGDVNGDGIDDCIIGAPRAGLSPRFASGNAYILYGAKKRSRASISSDQAGVTLYGRKAFDGFGTSVNYAGDINNDGISDVIIGSPFGSAISSFPEAYVIYGSSSNLPSSIQVDGLDESGLGLTFQLLHEDFAGSTNEYHISVASAGDINGDGKDDLIIGVPDIKNADEKMEGRVNIFLAPAVRSS